MLPSTPLSVNTAYTVKFKKAIKDADGIAVATPKAARLLTAAAPTLVRFRPTRGSNEIDPTQIVSVRFTRPMNHGTTAKAFSVVVGGRKVAQAPDAADHTAQAIVLATSSPLGLGSARYHYSEEPGWVEGSLISPSPKRGPDPRKRMSLAILIKLTAIVFNAPEVSTTASLPP